MMNQIVHSGIISEYNPFHNGHAWHIAETKFHTGNTVVAVMSGNFVQRGEPALLSKWARTEMALKNGVDLVIELPLPWAMSTAERFASGGVALLNALGCIGRISFGSECGNLSSLQNTADLLRTDDYERTVRALLSTGKTFAQLRAIAIETLGGDPSPLSRPNDTLAIEYLKALDTHGSSIRPLCILRTDAAHDSGRCSERICSASHIRKNLGALNLTNYMPQSALAILQAELAQGKAPASLGCMERAILAVLRRMSQEEMAQLPDMSEGLHNRLYRAVQVSNSIEEILMSTKTKRYTLARIRRILLSAYLGVPSSWAKENPPYLRVLGLNEHGQALLAQARETATLPIVMRYADIKKAGAFAQAVFALECRATGLYSLALPTVEPCNSDMTHSVVRV